MIYDKNLLLHLFGKPSLAEVSQDQLQDMVKTYPYFAHARWWLAAKKWKPGAVLPETFHAGAYAFHPLRLQQYLPARSPDDSPGEPAVPLIQPLFTEDYFAYTGAKLPEHIEDDKPPTMEQLHSFTDWLRTMRRPKGATDPDLRQDEASMAARAESEDAGIKKNAEESVRAGEEVHTEAMAEVRIRKGQADKAIAIYEKLSLSNPEKSAYFAQKIEALKNN